MTLNSSTVSAGQDALATQYNNLRKDIIEGSGDYGTTTGSANAYLLSVDAQVTSYVEGALFVFKANFTNTGTATLNVNSIGEKNLVDQAGNNVLSGEIENGRIYECIYDGTNLQIMNPKEKPSALFDNTYPAGETLSAGNVVFIENAPTTAQATSAQNIGDVTANTRVSFPVFGSGVAGTTLALNLAKTGSPSVALGVRIETDNAGSPSGTLVNANATGTVAAGGLTGSLVDTTVTLAGSITIPAGQKCHIVIFQGTYGSETVNATNFYSVGYYTNDTMTRFGKYWNGSVWGVGSGSPATEVAGLTGGTSGAVTAKNGLQITTKSLCYLKGITKISTCDATIAYLQDSGGTTLAQANFSGDVATFNYYLANATVYRVVVDKGGASYTLRYDGGASYPVVGTYVNFTSNYLNGTLDPTTKTVIVSIATASINAASYPYTSSTLFQPRVLSKTDADYTYKIDWHGITQEAVTVGDLTTGKYPKIAVSGIDSNQTGMTQGATMYLGNTAGSISSSAGTNSKKIGKAISDTKIKIVDIPL